MSQDITPRCFYCMLPVNPQVDDFCPHCHYPASPAKEEEYLKSALASLQQAMSYGGAQLKVVDLFQRYQNRLRMLQRPKASVAPPFIVRANAPEVALPASEMVASVPLRTDAPQMVEVSAQRRLFSWQSFFADQAINIVASLGAFLVLVGALSFVATTSNLLLAFLIVFIVHAVFGVTGFATHRFASFRIVASIYTIIFALLVPLVGFSAYRLIAGNYLEISVPALIAISAIYAAIVYTMLALFQRYTPFAYLGIAALAVADLALANALNLGYWWWPSMLMILALIGLVSIARSPGLNRIFNGNRAILRAPVRLFMYVFVVMGTLGIVVVTLYSIFEDSFSQYHSTEVGYAILCLSLLRLLWSIGGFWLARRTRGVVSLAFLFIVSVLAFCYALQFEAIGYALALTLVALFYASISRFAVQRLQAFGTLERSLDWIALGLVLLGPFIASPLLPSQLLVQVYSPGTVFQASWQTIAEVVAIFAGIILTLSVSFKRAGFQRTPKNPTWSWLLLLATFLFTWACSLIVLALHLPPDWSFLGVAIAFMVGAVIARARTGAAWADPLDISALFTIAITLGLSLDEHPDVLSRILLFFFAATYAILLYQRRSMWLFVPTIFAMLAIPTLTNHLIFLLTLGIAFPLVAVAIRHFFAHEPTDPNKQLPNVRWFIDLWEWPLLFVGLVYAVGFSVYDIISPISTIQQSLAIPCPVAIELAFFALSWYASAVLVRVKVWLLPALAFAISAILLPTNSFWALVTLTPTLAILAVVVRRFAGNVWSAPFATTALLAGIMTGYVGFTQQHLEAATAIALLAFAILAYVIGVTENINLPMWITPFFATWSVIVSAGFLNDLFRPPIVAVVAAALGVGVGLYRQRATRRPRLMLNALPLYATALIAALLTGAFGSFTNINVPFYGAVPDAMLVYALVAFGVVLFERRPAWLLVAAGFAIWGVALASQLTPYYVAGISAGAAAIGIIAGRVIPIYPTKLTKPESQQRLSRFTWSWPWYATTLLAALLTAFWSPGNPAQSAIIAFCMLGFTAIALLIMLIERIPEMLIFPIGFAAGTIWLWYPHLDVTSLMIAYTILCVVIFASQFVWRVLPPTKGWLAATTLHELLSIGGQAFVIMVILAQNGYSADAGTLAQVGAGALFTLTALIFAYGLLRPYTVRLLLPAEIDETASFNHMQIAKETQRWCFYIAGLLLSLVISWELSALRQVRLDVLLLAPASYLTVIAPFLMHDSVVRERRAIGQITAVLGACLLLLPALWFSFSDVNLLPTAILLGESLALLTLGMITRVRIFILSSAGLVIVGTLRALFLATPPSLTLMFIGITLLIIATALILTRRKLQVVWKQWE